MARALEAARLDRDQALSVASQREKALEGLVQSTDSAKTELARLQHEAAALSQERYACSPSEPCPLPARTRPAQCVNDECFNACDDQCVGRCGNECHNECYEACDARCNARAEVSRQVSPQVSPP